MKTYQEIISVVRGDIERLEADILESLNFPDDSLEKLFLAPAKRIRPALAFLFIRAAGLEPTNADFATQSAVELAHTASLIHDDIIDMSEKRRGLTTLNAKFGDKIGVLAGDYILSVALKKIADRPELVKEFLETFSQMAQGEINQYFTRSEIPSLDEYLLKTVQKTAGLFKLAIGKDFGLNFGIAFQIKNDLQDLQEDIKNGIYTAPVIFSGGTAITDFALDKTKELMNEYLDKAAAEVVKLPQNEYSKAIIEILALYRND